MKQHIMNCDCIECRVFRLEQPSFRHVETEVSLRDGIEKEAAQKSSEAGVGPRGSCCYDCGLKYPFGLDLVLPDKQWDWIFPEGNGEGLLCPNCIAKRAEKVGASTVLLSWIDRIDWAVSRPKEWFK